ncbi:hypothetical protein EYF80_023129 [Liparis tanakae]|uniref:Uncharacterized protein n=1 Tax=Liparis tanakae TaxID=230148 RepID=A0A4Z2HMT1_9TELE|nr:hypothetical protein EYF80_023129 [Liparis tanakae]
MEIPSLSVEETMTPGTPEIRQQCSEVEGVPKALKLVSFTHHLDVVKDSRHLLNPLYHLLRILSILSLSG